MATAESGESLQKNALSNLSKVLLQRKHQPDQALRKKPKRKHRRNNPLLEDEKYQETSYYFKDDLRWVYPYSFTFEACAKKRWFGLPLLQLFTEEFHTETEDYYKRAIASGRIKVNNENATEDQQLKNKDVVKNIIHRHEPPVLHQDIEFLCNDNEMVVVDKPPSIPVHPGGRYRHNSIVFLLGKEHGLQGLHPINRLDHQTSGVLMFSKNVTKAKEMTFQVHKTSSVEKEYLARVVGEFPEEEVVVTEPVLTASHEVTVCHVHEDGEKCTTKFKRLSYNGKSSVVSCKALSLRMHQIRVHLHSLGHPVINDPVYNHPTAWGNEEQKNEISEVIAVLVQTLKDSSDEDGTPTEENESDPSPKRRKTDNAGTTAGKKEADAAASTVAVNDGKHTYTSADIGEEYVDADCSDCKRTWKQPLPSELQIYLHALCYKGPDWEYKTSTPDWAKEEWNIN